MDNASIGLHQKVRKIHKIFRVVFRNTQQLELSNLLLFLLFFLPAAAAAAERERDAREERDASVFVPPLSPLSLLISRERTSAST
jgi:hypothetical protein